ncbi:hypothetical protein [Pseudomonas hunanensis]|uniref:hypothetical protein n=1 Tax=Pseudomonas hunanensis TaxID=1247546 RepID=UPI0030DC13CF
MIIGLAGGSPEDRQAVADSLQAIKNGPSLWAWSVESPLDTRAESLAAFLRGRRRQRRVRGQRPQGLLYTHVLLETEAQALRDAGGVIWHVRGAPSRMVANRHGDLQVTPEDDGAGHYLGPAEALSELLLSRRRGRGDASRKG